MMQAALFTSTHKRMAMCFRTHKRKQIAVLAQAVDSKLLMHAVLFTSTHKGAANNACNCSNGAFDPQHSVCTEHARHAVELTCVDIDAANISSECSERSCLLAGDTFRWYFDNLGVLRSCKRTGCECSHNVNAPTEIRLDDAYRRLLMQGTHVVWQ